MPVNDQNHQLAAELAAARGGDLLRYPPVMDEALNLQVMRFADACECLSHAVNCETTVTDQPPQIEHVAGPAESPEQYGL